jgi:hypothetical protein
MNSGKRAPGSGAPPLGFSGGVRGTPGQTRKRALPHQGKTDLRANSSKTIDGHTAQENRFMQGGRPTAGVELVRNWDLRAPF